MPRVSIIIVSYCSSGELTSCVESCLNQRITVEILIVDNASPDRSREVAQDLASRFPQVTAIANETNVGLAAANNQAIGRCRGEYVLVLNPDTAFRGPALAEMVSILDSNPEVGILGPKSYFANGRPHRSFHDGWGLWHILGWRAAPYSLMRSFWDLTTSYRERTPLFVSGACLLIRRELFEGISGYDPEFFLAIEDACDLCVRARQAGYGVLFSPRAEVTHIGGRSGSQAPYKVVWHGYRGSIYFFLKHKSRLALTAAWLILTASAAARWATATLLSLRSKRYLQTQANYRSVLLNLLHWNPTKATEPPIDRGSPLNAIHKSDRRPQSEKETA